MLHILCIGAHPDDNEVSLGGTASLYRRLGDAVTFVSVTTGNKGHFSDEYKADPSLLANRRRAEAQAAAAVIGANYRTLGINDGEVYVTKENTDAIVRLIRSLNPDVVFLNRPGDYHRDHRYTAQLVLDSAYMLTVPLYCPDTRHLDRMPVFAYCHDDFTEAGPFRADVTVPLDPLALEQKLAMITCHESQFFEWLPFNAGHLTTFPADRDARLQLIAQRFCSQSYESFQISQYGRSPSPAELAILFPLRTAASHG